MPADQTRVTSPGLTDQQRRAVTARGVSVALSAGAGCGKTLVLTERFLAELEPDGAAGRPRLSQLVAITFTERAAREMRDRIRAACRRRLQECPQQQANYWLELIRELDSARISTIHSFCAWLLRAHAVEAGVDPRFRVLDGSQAGTLLFELTDDVLRGRLAQRDEAVLRLATRFGLDRLREVIARLLVARQEIDWHQWQNETAEGLAARWEEFWRRDGLPRLLRRIGRSAVVQTLLDLAAHRPSNHPTMQQRCEFLLEHIPKLPASEQPADELKSLRQAAKVQGGGTKKDWASAEAYERFRDAAKTLRQDIDAIEHLTRFDAAAARPAAEMALQALGLAADAAERYQQRKQELGVLDFDDLLIHARQLLVGPGRRGLRKRLAAQIRLLLVDEFQDTDPLQVELVKALCDDEHLRGKLFLVGDYKQSIYRFRGADPRVFRRLREEIPPAGRLPLSLNFRSQPAVLDFINALFCEESARDYEPLRPHRPQLGPVPAVEFLWATDEGREERGEGRGEKEEDRRLGTSVPSEVGGPRERLRRREADWIARRIRQLLEGGEKIVWDEAAARAGRPAVRAVRPGDFALLFRALTNVEYYEEALRRHGIDYYLVGGHAFYAQQEIYDLLNLLRTINSPCDEVSLAGVLRSPMFGLHDETLFWLFLNRKKHAAGLLDGPLPEEIEGPQRRQAEFALATLRDLRAMKDRLPVAQLIHEALRRTGYDALLLAEFLGQRKLANLHKLIEQARSFDRSGIFTLSDFITQLAQFVARQPDEPLAATQPESTEVVKLMSIHQAKGLEFPVVIVPDVGRPRRVIGPAAAFTPQLGPVLKDSNITTGYDLLMAAETDEDLAELGRLLYVAATRAADYLILSAGVERPGEAAGPWMELIAGRFDPMTGKPRDSGLGTRDSGLGTRDSGLGMDGSPPIEAGSPIPNPEPRAPSPEPPAPRLVKVTTVEPPIGSKPVDLRQRRDLLKIVERARQMADDGQGRRPRYLAPVACDVRAWRQYSFSRLTGNLHVRTAEIDAAPPDGEASPGPPLDARGLGTLVHAALEEIDFVRPGDLNEMVRRLAEQHLPPSERRQEESIAIEMLDRFLASPRAAQLAAASQMHRELEFLLAWPPGDARPEGRYLQGFIDCLYRDTADRWRLIDYKTNRVTADTLAATAAQYEMQMLVYALAAEIILKSSPAELVLCFLRPGLEHQFTWDAAARRRAVELVERALP